jgi:hypothetical protein
MEAIEPEMIDGVKEVLGEFQGEVGAFAEVVFGEVAQEWVLLVA